MSCDIQDVSDEFGQPIVLSGMDGVKGGLIFLCLMQFKAALASV